MQSGWSWRDRCVQVFADVESDELPIHIGIQNIESVHDDGADNEEVLVASMTIAGGSQGRARNARILVIRVLEFWIRVRHLPKVDAVQVCLVEFVKLTVVVNGEADESTEQADDDRCFCTTGRCRLDPIPGGPPIAMLPR